MPWLTETTSTQLNPLLQKDLQTTPDFAILAAFRKTMLPDHMNGAKTQPLRPLDHPYFLGIRLNKAAPPKRFCNHGRRQRSPE